MTEDRMVPRYDKGRPPKYDPGRHPEEARKLALLGLTNEQIAEFFEIDVATFYRWQDAFPEFCEAVRRGKVIADGEVAASFYKRATGYEYDSEKVFCSEGEIIRADTTTHVPPDPGAALNWLKNRQPDKWRDKRQLEIDDEEGNTYQFPVVRIFGEKPKEGD